MLRIFMQLVLWWWYGFTKFSNAEGMENHFAISDSANYLIFIELKQVVQKKNNNNIFINNQYT